MNDNLSQQIDAHKIRLDKIQRQLDSLHYYALGWNYSNNLYLVDLRVLLATVYILNLVQIDIQS